MKLDAIHDQLTKSVAALVTGDDWRRALEFAARFRSRSFNNTVLIYVHQNAAYQAGLGRRCSTACSEGRENL